MRTVFWTMLVSFGVGLVVLGQATQPAGGPYKLTFKVVKTDTKITIDPATFKVFDKDGGEVANPKYSTEPAVSFVDGDKTIPAGKMSLGWGGGLCAYSGGVPSGLGNDAKVVITATCKGLGEVRGEAPLK